MFIFRPRGFDVSSDVAKGIILTYYFLLWLFCTRSLCLDQLPCFRCCESVHRVHGSDTGKDPAHFPLGQCSLIFL